MPLTRQELVEKMLFAGDKAGTGYCVEEEQAEAMLSVVLENINDVAEGRTFARCDGKINIVLKPSFRKQE